MLLMQSILFALQSSEVENDHRSGRYYSIHSKERNPTQMQQQNHMFKKLVSHANKLLLIAISNIMKYMHTPVRRTSWFQNWEGEQIANVRIQNEKYTNHKMGTYHNFMAFKKAFDRVWSGALSLVMQKHDIGANMFI